MIPYLLTILTGNGSSEELMVVAKYDYRAKDTQELNICKNEKLTLIDDSKHWWLVSLLLTDVICNSLHCWWRNFLSGG